MREAMNAQLRALRELGNAGPRQKKMRSAAAVRTCLDGFAARTRKAR
jgi:hypothetical protein